MKIVRTNYHKDRRHAVRTGRAQDIVPRDSLPKLLLPHCDQFLGNKRCTVLPVQPKFLLIPRKTTKEATWQPSHCIHEGDVFSCPSKNSDPKESGVASTTKRNRNTNDGFDMSSLGGDLHCPRSQSCTRKHQLWRITNLQSRAWDLPSMLSKSMHRGPLFRIT